MTRKRTHLDHVERASTCWQKTTAVIADRMAAHTAVATNPNNDEQRRYAAAVRISELKELLKLAEPAQEQSGGAGD